MGIVLFWGLLALSAILALTSFFRQGDGMSRREEWRKVLQIELSRWSSMSARDVYVVVAESKQYQVEVELLEDTPEYLHVSIAVDDGGLPASIHPESETFLCRKAQELLAVITCLAQVKYEFRANHRLRAGSTMSRELIGAREAGFIVVRTPPFADSNLRIQLRSLFR
jgi:hypothetical protein